MKLESSSPARGPDQGREPIDRLPSRLLFLTVVIAELIHTGAAIAAHRVPSGHDGFQYFTIQYYFLNNAVQSHQVAQWIPYMNQGTVATFWYAIQGSLLQDVLLYVSPLVGAADVLVTYHLGMFVDEMVLLTGTWLLARRFFRTPAVFFVSVSVVGSCVWLDQPYWNFRLYYAVPLVLELGHRFLESGHWRWFFLAANLLALQAVGNLPYFLPLASFVVFVYFVSYAASQHRLVWERLRALSWRAPAVAAVAFGAISFAAAYWCLTAGTDQLVSYSPGRSRDGSTSLAEFLTYGGLTDLRKWIDAVLNVSPWLDATLYGGVLLIPLVLCGLAVADRQRIHLVLVAATMLLFTLSTPVSALAYHAWPGMRYFRHIGLVSPLVKVLLCFVAAIGFERLFDPGRRYSRRAGGAAAVAAAVSLVASAWLAWHIAGSASATQAYVNALSIAGVDRPAHVYEPAVVAHRLRTAVNMALAGAAVVGAIPLMAVGVRMRSPATARLILCGVLGFVAADVYRFKFAYLFDRSDALGSEGRSVVLASPMTYPRRRAPETADVVATNPRASATIGFNQALWRQFQGRSSFGAQYWSNNAFWFTDEAGATFRTDSWLKPLDQLMRMFSGTAIDDTRMPPAGWLFGTVRFPLDHVAARKASGVEEDKIRFFVRAYHVEAADDLVPLMTDPSYGGDLLFLVAPRDSGRGPMSEPWSSQVALTADDSQALPYEVKRFDGNNLVVEVVNPLATAVWMSYADVWHPLWTATVNGRPAPVYRASMAYKAVALDGGPNTVHFEFGSPLFAVLSMVVSANSAFWLSAVGWMIADLCRPRVSTPDSRSA